MSVKLAPETNRNASVQENSRHWNLSCGDLCHQSFLGKLENGNRVFASHRGEVFKEAIERIPRLEVIEKRLDRNAGSAEHWSSSQAFRR
jgi:hypothetical protein